MYPKTRRLPLTAAFAIVSAFVVSAVMFGPSIIASTRNMFLVHVMPATNNDTLDVDGDMDIRAGSMVGVIVDTGALNGSAHANPMEPVAGATPVCTNTLYGADTTGKLFTLNITTGAGTLVNPLLPAAPSTEIEYDPSTGRVTQTGGTAFSGSEFNIVTGAPIGSVIPNAHTFTGLEWVGPTLYGASFDIQNGPSSLRILDPWTGASSLIGATGVGPISGLAYNTANGVMYGIEGGAAAAHNLLTINLATGAATIIGATNIVAGSLEFGPNGLLYAGNSTGNLYTINPATGTATLVGATGFGTLSGLANACPPAATPTPTATATATSTTTPTFTPTSTATATPTATATSTATSTATATSTPTPTVTPTATSTPTSTPTATPAFTPTATPTPGSTMGLLYALNDEATGSRIYGFQVNETTGALTLLGGFPVFAENGGLNSIVSERMVADQLNLRLYVINDGAPDSVSAYSINPATGALTEMPFSPIILGAGTWNTIAVHPGGSPLIVSNGATGGGTSSFNITATTATPAVGSPFATTGTTAFSSRFSQNGSYFYVGGNTGNVIAGFSVDTVTGILTPLPGSPFDTGAANPLAYATDSAGRLFTMNSNDDVRAFTSTAGALSPVAGNPFSSGGLGNRRFGLVHPSGNFYMIAGNTGNNVGVFQIAGSGSATTLTAVAGSPFATGGTTANALAVNASGAFLYVANRISRNITTFGVNAGTGSLTNLNVQPSNTMGTTGAINGIAYVAAASGPSPTPTATPTGSPTGTATPTATPTTTPTATPVVTPTGTFTPTPTATGTATPTATATGTATGTATPTATSTPTASPTAPQQTMEVNFSASTYTEDESQTFTTNLRRTGNTTVSTTVTFATSNGTAVGGPACTAGVDYISVIQVVTFAPGVTSVPVSVQLCADGIDENNLETVNLTITGPFAGLMNTAVLRINDTANAYRNTVPIQCELGTVANPYPSSITVTNGPTSIGGLRVTIYDMWHVLPDNLDILLVGPLGQEYVLMGDAGGTTAINPATPVTLTFQDLQPQVLPDNGPLTTGTYEPTTWESPVTNFPAPAPPGPYVEPGSMIGGPIETTLFGTFGLTNANGTWSLYVRDDGGNVVAITCEIAGGWGLEFLAPTAAQASISGRVTTADGTSIRNAEMVLTGNSLETPLRVSTSSFGYFTFDGLHVGETYVLTVNSRRFTFQVPNHVISLTDNVTGMDFIANAP